MAKDARWRFAASNSSIARSDQKYLRGFVTGGKGGAVLYPALGRIASRKYRLQLKPPRLTDTDWSQALTSAGRGSDRRRRLLARLSRPIAESLSANCRFGPSGVSSPSAAITPSPTTPPAPPPGPPTAGSTGPPPPPRPTATAPPSNGPSPSTPGSPPAPTAPTSAATTATPGSPSTTATGTPSRCPSSSAPTAALRASTLCDSPNPKPPRSAAAPRRQRAAAAAGAAQAPNHLPVPRIKIPHS